MPKVQESTSWIESGANTAPYILAVMYTLYRGAITKHEPHAPWFMTGEDLHDQSIVMVGGVVYAVDFDVLIEFVENALIPSVLTFFTVVTRVGIVSFAYLALNSSGYRSANSFIPWL